MEGFEFFEETVKIKYMYKILVLVFAIILVVFFVTKLNFGTKVSHAYLDDKFKPGQVWSYKTRQGEENSSMEILRVEKYDEFGIVIHVAVKGVNIRSADGKVNNQIPHLPFTKEAIERSVIAMVQENQPLPQYEMGYNLWKDAINNRKGGVWTITVSEAITLAEDALNKK